MAAAGGVGHNALTNELAKESIGSGWDVGLAGGTTRGELLLSDGENVGDHQVAADDYLPLLAL